MNIPDPRIAGSEKDGEYGKKILAACWFALLGLILFQGFYLDWWLRRDTRPPAWDESHHLRIALSYRNALDAGRWIQVLRPVYSNYPPLYHLSLAATLSSQARESPDIVDRAVRVNIVYWTVLLISLFLLGMRLHSPGVGLAVAIIGSFYSGSLFLLRRPMIDVPLASLVTLAFVGLIWRERSTKVFWGIIAGVVVSAGMLTKWTFAVYVGLPLVFALVNEWKAGRRARVLAFLIAVVVVAGPWYSLNLIPSILRITKLSSLKEAGDPNIWTWAGWTWYARGLVRQLILWPMVVPLVFGSYVAVRRKRWDLLLWVAIPLICFSLIRNKDLRYYVPSLPAVALLSVMSVTLFKRSSLQKIWLAVWVLGGSVLGLSYSVDRISFFWPATFQPEAHRDPPKAEDWQSEKVIEAFRMTAQGSGGPRISLIANHPYFHSGIFRFLAACRGYEVLIETPKRNLGDFADFILWKDDKLGPAYTLGYVEEADRLLREPPHWLRKTFSERERWALPDGSSAVLYAKNVQDSPWPRGLGELELALDRFPLPRFQAKGIRVMLRPDSPDAARKGRFAELTVSCKRLDYRGLILDNVKLKVLDAQVNLPLLLERKELHFLSIGELHPSADIESSVVQRYLEAKARWLRDPEVTFQDGIRVKGRFWRLGLEIRAQVSLSQDRRFLDVELDSLRIGGVPIPRFLAGPFAQKRFSLQPTKDLPFTIKLAGLETTRGRLKITGEL